MSVTRAAALCALIVAGPVFVARADQAAPLGRFDYLPYAVSVSVTFSPDAEVTAVLRQSICTALSAKIEQTFGAAWVFATGGTVRIDDRLTPPDSVGLDRLTYKSASQRLSGITCDKAYFLTVSRQGPSWTVTGREWDRSSEVLGPPDSETTVERRRVSDAALAVIKRIFSPLLIVTDADRNSKSAVLTVRAGSIPFGDPHFQTLRAGDILQPVFRFLDAKRAVRSIQSVPWTYLVLDRDAKGQSQVSASVISSYRAPLAANMRRRVEALAVRVRLNLPDTQLKVVAGRNPSQPQAGLFVSVIPLSVVGAARGSSENPPAKAKPGSIVEGTKTQLLTDRRGEVTIPVDRNHPIVRLEVHSGTAILARRPFMPGFDHEVTLEVADDHVRLSAERDIDILESQLIETVARRGSLLAQMRAALRVANARRAQQVLTEVEKLTASDEFFAQLNKIRVLALEEARRSKDRVAERRVEDLCKKTLERITQYLPDDRIELFREQVAELSKPKTVTRPPLAPTAPPRESPLRRGAERKSPSAPEKEPSPASGI
jgi:hypothetical protein